MSEHETYLTKELEKAKDTVEVLKKNLKTENDLRRQLEVRLDQLTEILGIKFTNLPPSTRLGYLVTYLQIGGQHHQVTSALDESLIRAMRFPEEGIRATAERHGIELGRKIDGRRL